MRPLTKVYLITTITVLFVVISTVSFLHNHKIDVKPHENCPACILTSTLQSSIITFNNDNTLDLPLMNSSITVIVILFKSNDFKFLFNNKSPPF